MSYLHSCPINGCMGVMEFIGEQENVGSPIQLKARADELDSINKEEASVLVYRCSSCKTVSTRLNEAFETHIKLYKDNRYKEEFEART